MDANIRLSSRLPPVLAPNRISEAVDRNRREGIEIVNLTESNPTVVGLPYPESILDALADARAMQYDPHPFGSIAAREAVAHDCMRRGATVKSDDVILTSSTSESYSWLFKLICDPGEAVLVPTPSYPLFEHLTRFDGVAAIPYRLEYHGRWEIDPETLAAAPSSVRAVIMVSPNNPTGSYVTTGELAAVLGACRERGWVLIVDEVFADYPLDAARPLTDVALQADVLAFTLGGASKMLGLPQVKLGWMVAGGPQVVRRHALHALEHLADAYLSVSTPVQVAVPSLIRDGRGVRSMILARVRQNLAVARMVARKYPSCEVLRAEGGWFATVRVPATRPEDTLVLELLACERILVHPGYFFDFPHEAFVVISLLPEPAVFADAFERTLRFVS